MRVPRVLKYLVWKGKKLLGFKIEGGELRIDRHGGLASYDPLDGHIYLGHGWKQFYEETKGSNFFYNMIEGVINHEIMHKVLDQIESREACHFLDNLEEGIGTVHSKINKSRIMTESCGMRIERDNELSEKETEALSRTNPFMEADDEEIN